MTPDADAPAASATEEAAMLGTIAGAVLLIGFALLAYWADVTNERSHRDQRAVERARTLRSGR